VADPRLDLAACPSASERVVAFAWVEPDARARYVVVRQDRFAEAYRTAGGLPVRIASTSRIDITHSAATFAVSEHDGQGRLLHRYALRAQVAG